MNAIDWGHVIAAAAGIAAIVFGFAAFRRNDKHDERADARQQGVILTELGYIKGGVDDIKLEQREQRKINAEVTNKLAAIETATAQAHARIDRLEQHKDLKSKA